MTVAAVAAVRADRPLDQLEFLDHLNKLTRDIKGVGNLIWMASQSDAIGEEERLALEAIAGRVDTVSENAAALAGDFATDVQRRR